MTNATEDERRPLPPRRPLENALPRWMLAVVAAASVAAWSVGAAAAQQPAPVATLTIDAVETSGGSVTAAVSALDASGRPVAGLSGPSFVVGLDGTPIPGASAESAASSALPLSLVLVIDTSGSMAGAALAAAKAATTDLVAALQPSDHVSVISFASTVATPTAFDGDRSVAANAISALTANGNTALYAATRRAAETARLAPDRRRAVVFLTDGEDFGNASAGVTRDGALSAAAAAGVPFYVVGVGSEVDRAFLSSLGADTGGQYLAATTSDELKPLYALISDRLRLQYTVRFVLPPGLAGGVHRIRMGVGSATAETAFTTATDALAPHIAGVDNVITTPVVATVDGIGAVPVRFALDGVSLTAGPDGRSVRLDPFEIDPSSHHELTAAWDSGGETKSLKAAVNVSALAPVLLSPTELPGLRPGDLVRVTVRAQPGARVEMSADIDGGQIAHLAAPPFELTVPAEFESAGNHELSISLTGAGGTAQHAFPFVVAAPNKGSPTAAYVLIAIAAAAGLATLVAAVCIGVRRLTRRPDTDITSPPMPARGPGSGQPPKAAPSASTPWGTFTVVSGRGHGRCFALTEDRELLGSGKFCSVLIGDGAVREAHAVLERDGTIQASSPACAIQVDGEPVRRALLRDGSEVLVGATMLRFERCDAGTLPLST